MIDVNEFRRFKLAEGMHAARYINSDDETVEIRLEGHLPVIVYSSADMRAGKFDFVWTRFGVVRLLDARGHVIDKSPLCEELDKAIIAIHLTKTKNDYMRGNHAAKL